MKKPDAIAWRLMKKPDADEETGCASAADEKPDAHGG